ncbi:MAG: hypothetical protein ACODAA_07905, partial [Gemmatimonadota bacterium]
MSRRALLPVLPVLAFLAAGVVATGCGRGFPPPELPPFDPIAEPRPDEVEAVVFLVGDAGATASGRSPLLARLGAEVERWSAALG